MTPPCLSLYLPQNVAGELICVESIQNYVLPCVKLFNIPVRCPSLGTTNMALIVVFLTWNLSRLLS